MKSYTALQNGKYLQSDSFESGSLVNGKWSHYSTPADFVEQRFAFRKDLTAAAQGAGNFVSPVAQSYSVNTYTTLNGTLRYTSFVKDQTSYNRRTRLQSGPTGTYVNLYSISPDELAYNKCLNKVVGATRGELNLAISLAEGGQTMRMLRSIANLSTYVKTTKRSILKFAEAEILYGVVRYGRKAKASQFRNQLAFDRKTVANQFLQWKLGITPLISDVVNSAKAVSNGLPGMQRIRERASVFTQKTFVTQANGVTTTDVVQQNDRCEMSFLWKPTNTLNSAIGSVMSLNPLSIAWELAPLSFVIDYVYDVGNYIRNVETALLYSGTQVLGYVTETSRSTLERTVSYSKKESYPGDWNISGALKGTHIRTTKRRTPISTFPTQGRPSFKADIGSSQLLTVAALLNQALPRR